MQSRATRVRRAHPYDDEVDTNEISVMGKTTRFDEVKQHRHTLHLMSTTSLVTLHLVPFLLNVEPMKSALASPSNVGGYGALNSIGREKIRSASAPDGRRRVPRGGGGVVQKERGCRKPSRKRPRRGHFSHPPPQEPPRPQSPLPPQPALSITVCPVRIRTLASNSHVETQEDVYRQAVLHSTR
jgi:hypothetical protein